MMPTPSRDGSQVITRALWITSSFTLGASWVRSPGTIADPPAADPVDIRGSAVRTSPSAGDSRAWRQENLATPRNRHPTLLRGAYCLIVAGVGMPDHAHAGVRSQHALQAAGGARGAVGHHHHAGVQRVADAHPAT